VNGAVFSEKHEKILEKFKKTIAKFAKIRYHIYDIYSDYKIGYEIFIHGGNSQWQKEK